MPKLKFKLPAIESENLSLLCGPVNTNLNQIEQSLEVKIKSRGNSFSISGDKNNVIKSKLIIEDLASLAKSKRLSATFRVSLKKTLLISF